MEVVAGAWVIKIILRLSLEIHTPLLLALVVLLQTNQAPLYLVAHLILLAQQLFRALEEIFPVVVLQVTAAVKAAIATQLPLILVLTPTFQAAAALVGMLAKEGLAR
jgi:hypothetical protein